MSIGEWFPMLRKLSVLGLLDP